MADLSSKVSSVFLTDVSSLIEGQEPDLDLIVNDAKTFPVHSVILAQASEKLRQLASQASVSPGSQTRRLHVNIDEDQAFGDFVKFLYSRELPVLTATQLLSLSDIAVQFDVEALRTIIEQSLSDRLNFATATTDADVDMVLRLLPRLSTLFGSNASSAVIRFAASHAYILFRQPFAVDVDLEVLLAIITSGKLRVSSRTQLSSFLSLLRQRHPNEPRIVKLLKDEAFLSNIRTDPTGIAASIACFFADGSEKYTEMTKHAVKTFLQSTPEVTVGILTHDQETREALSSDLPRQLLHRIIWKRTSETEHIPGWNQTQYKLDIIKFAESCYGLENIFWFDSDTISFEDSRPFLTRFSSQSEYAFYMTPDHVMRSESFRNRWTPNWPLNLVPQACVMGFKTHIMEEFFKVWVEKWRDWVTPFPFAYLPDPNPSFSGSAFCTEQYGLGLALNKNNWHKQVLTFDRRLVIVQGQTFSHPLSDTDTKSDQDSGSGASGGSHWAEEARQEARKQTYKQNLRVVVIPAEYTMASQYFVEKGDMVDTHNSSTNPMTSVSFSLAMLSVPLSVQSSLLSFSGIQIQPGSVVADLFGGAFLHTYNQNYAVVKSWLDEQQKGR